MRRQADGIAIYTHLGLMQVGPVVKIAVRGVWRLSWLEVRGLSGGAACGMGS